MLVNGLTTVASAFETLSEAEARFVKTADRECEGSSNEIKKWFKKLAVRHFAYFERPSSTNELCVQKEEKAHDDRIAAANLKIKQAGSSRSRTLSV